MKTIILGNGILALTVAFRLAMRSSANDKIIIVGKKSRVGSASLAAGAMLNSFAEIDVDSLKSELDLYRFELSHQATRMWPKFEKEIIEAGGSHLPPGCAKCLGFQGGGCVDTGTYVINNTAADDLDDANFDAIVAALTEFNEPFQHVSPREIPNYMPEQRHRATRAIYLYNEGWFNPRLMIEKLDAILSHHPSVEFIEEHVECFEKRETEIDSAILENGQRLCGDKFVLATGASVNNILDNSDLGIPVQRVFYGVGVSLEIQSTEYPNTKCIRTPNRGLACGIYTTPYFTDPGVPADHILVGASNFISPTPVQHGRISSVESLLAATINQVNFNFYKAGLIRVNVGWRPASQDTYPMLGKTSYGNLVILTGTKRDGFHMAPLISQNVVAMLYDESVDERFSVFAPERKSLHTMTREAAIDKAVRHLTSANYQHGFSPAQNRMPEQLAQMYRDDLERLHDKVGAIDWGIPIDMLDMYRYGHAKP